MEVTDKALSLAERFLERAAQLDAQYRAGRMHVSVPDGLRDSTRSLELLVEQHLPASHAALAAASRGLFFSLPVAFNPAESVGPYLAIADRDPGGQPYRFLDMGALIATQAFGENDPALIRGILESFSFVISRYAHSEYQTTLSLRLKATLTRIAPAGTPRHFVVNTGAEAVENAIKAVLMNRVMSSDEGEGGFIVSFEGAFHGRTLGALAVTHRKKARLGFPTFDWPHIPFPVEAADSPKETARREERSLKQLWDLIVSGRLPHAEKSKDTFRREIDALDEFLADPGQDLPAFLQAQRANLTPDVIRRSRRVAAVLIEPIQGEGGVRLASARFMRKLRLLTRIYDVPLVFDEVQTGWGMTGRLWAHELFDLPSPPDVVTWAKKAQNGVLFVSEELATFFQEEKKFNTTWEGDSVGMVRLLAMLDKLDLEQVRRTGERARIGLETLAREFRWILKNVRGVGVMLGFDVMRADWCEALLDRAFRRGLVLLPAGDRTVRFYPRYDSEPSAIDEALSILRLAIEDLAGGRIASDTATALKVRVGTLAIPLETVETVDLTPATFQACKLQILAVEQERYRPEAPSPSDAPAPATVLAPGQGSLLQLPLETLEATMASPRAIGIALRDRVSGRFVGYALGSALENHNDEGVSSDPRFGENNTFYLQAMAASPTVQNAVDLENSLLESLRERAIAAGFDFLSTLIEDRLRDTGPAWFRGASVLERIENYLHGGSRFAYLQLPLKSAEAPPLVSPVRS